MKKRATHKVDLDGFVRQMDARATGTVDILVGTSGEVVCLQTSSSWHPLIRVAVEKALKSWTFKPETRNGKPVAYLGHLELKLCNLGCRPGDSPMTLLE